MKHEFLPGHLMPTHCRAYVEREGFCGLPASDDLHMPQAGSEKEMSQSSEQGAPERIWLTRNQHGSIEGTWHKMEGLTPAIRELGRPIYEYTRSDICASLVEALQELVNSPIEFEDSRITYVTMQVDTRTIEAARTALGLGEKK